MAMDLLIPPRPSNGHLGAAASQRHQPWLPGAVPLPVSDDFSAASTTHRLRGVALGLVLAALVLAMGRSAQIVDAAYGLDTLPGTEMLIAAAEAWHEHMTSLGVPEALTALRQALGVASE